MWREHSRTSAHADDHGWKWRHTDETWATCDNVRMSAMHLKTVRSVLRTTQCSRQCALWCSCNWSQCAQDCWSCAWRYTQCSVAFVYRKTFVNFRCRMYSIYKFVGFSKLSTSISIWDGCAGEMRWDEMMHYRSGNQTTADTWNRNKILNTMKRTKLWSDAHLSLPQVFHVAGQGHSPTNASNTAKEPTWRTKQWETGVHVRIKRRPRKTSHTE